MTQREFFEMVIAGKNTAEMQEKAAELIAALDKKNAQRKSPESKEKQETAARLAAVLAVLTTEPQSRDEIAALAGVTAGQATAALTALAKSGKVSKTEVKVDKNKRMAYALAVSETEETAE